MANTRIPKKVWLPGNEDGFTIRVKQIDAKDMKAKFDEDYDGLWDSDTNTIWLKQHLSKQRKWYIYGHEFVHAVTDWTHWLANQEIAKA